jgi:transcriptional regulator with XRE-family HTH domain
MQRVLYPDLAYAKRRTTMNNKGDRIRLRREELGLTQREVAERLAEAGVKYGQAHISRLEHGWTKPGPEIMVGLAQVLQTSREYLELVTDDPAPQDKEVKEDTLALSAEAIALARLIDTLPADIRTELLAALKTLANLSYPEAI